jgi:hypothetical protein
MKRLLLAAALVVTVAAPASASAIDPGGPALAVAAASGDEHDPTSEEGEDEGTDLLTFVALLVGGTAVVLALAAFVRAGHRLPQ